MGPDGALPLAIYRRTIHATLARIWENVLDWEHLPWLHRSTFSSVQCLEQGSGGWKARVGLQPEALRQETLIQVELDRPGLRYVTRTLEGVGKGTEIWTQLAPRDDGRTDIEVEFHLHADPTHAEAIGTAYRTLYTQLWDEDEGMMRRRESQLARRVSEAAETIVLGTLVDLRERLPLRLDVGGHPFRLIEREGALLVHSTVCPHRLGPLEEAELVDGCVRCPWHGYRFELQSGACRDDDALRLVYPPRIEIDPVSSEVRLVSRGASVTRRARVAQPDASAKRSI